MSNSWRATLFLSAIFFAFGIQLPYLPVWLEVVRGLSGSEIAIVLFASSLCRVVTGPLIAAWIDGHTGRAAALRLSAGIVLAYAGLNLFESLSAIFIFGWVALTLVWSAMPFGEGLILLCRDDKSAPFGVNRAIGSTLFLCGVFSGGLLLDRYGEATLGPAITVLYFVAFLSAFFAPQVPISQTGSAMSLIGRLKRGAGLFRDPVLALLILASGLIQSTHAFYYGFATLVWQEQGFSGSANSFLWSVGVLVEIVILASATRLSKMKRPELLLMAGAVAALVRWGFLAFSPGYEATILLQTLHGFTFATTFLGTIAIVDARTSRDDKAIAVGFLGAISMGSMLGLAGLASGWIYDQLAVKGYLVMAGLGGLGLFAAFALQVVGRRIKPVLNS